MQKLAKKVLLIGWDAADWKMINPLVDAGEMPALERLINNGVMGNLATLEPPFSPMLWTSIATGKRPDKHGILGFTEPDPNTGGVRPVSCTSRKVKAIWNILTQKGYKTNVIGWWPSHPAEPVNGVTVSNFYQRAGAGIEKPWPMVAGTVHPENLADTFKNLRIHPDELTEQHILPFIPNAAKIDQDKDPRLGMLSKIIADCATIHAAATWTMENTEWDFMGVYFDAIDHFGHGFMKFHPPQLPGLPTEIYEMYKDVMVSGYKFHDMMLGRLLQLAGEDTTVILMSDHGFHSDHLRPLSLPDEPAAPAMEHRPYGIFCMKGPNIKKDERIYGATLLDICPTLLTLFGLPTGADMDGHPLVQAFDCEINPERIPSWEDVSGECGMHPDGIKEDPYAAQEALEQLVQLGYIEDPGEDKQKAVEKTITESQYNLGRVYIGSNRYQLALPIFEELYKKNPDEVRFAQRLAACYQQLKETKKCKKLIGEIKILLVKKQEEKKKIALEELDKNEEVKSEEKEKIKKNILARKKENFPALDLLEGTILLGENKIEEAMQLFQKAEEQAPSLPNLYLQIGRGYLQLKKFEDAERAFSKALSIDGDSAQAHHGIGVSFLRQKKYEEAIDACLNAVGLMYHFPFAHYHLGEALAAIGEYQQAAQAFEVCLSMAPNISKARNWLIEIYSKYLGEQSKADEIAQRGIIVPKENDTNTVNKEQAKEVFQQKAEQHKKELKEKSLGEIIIVSGLPRSGTSMMMQMLDKGGLPIFTDKKRTADESNPKGYYEHEAVKNLARDKSFIKNAAGKCVKVISQLLVHLPPRYTYKVLFMERDLQEVVTSQHKMLVRDGKAKEGNYPMGLELAFKNNLERIKIWAAKNYNVAILYISYKDTIKNPKKQAIEINDFLEKNLDIEKMTAAVDSSLYRNKQATS